MIRKKKDMVTPYGTVTQCTDVPWYRYPLSYCNAALALCTVLQIHIDITVL